jgi:peptidoglycan/LPS O-acetylase OafA/YrhL
MQTESAARVPELDGLRGAAILSVLVFHYTAEQGTVASPAVSLIQRIFIMGWSGVDLFFVLSGFLIGGILLEARSSPSFFKTFYFRRFFRIIPIYYAWILAYILLIAVAGAAVRAHSNSGIVVNPNFTIYAHFLFLQNLMVVSLGGLAGAWFSHLWSLAVEEQFYLVSPLVVRLLSPRSLKFFLISLIVFAPCLRIFLQRVVHANPQFVTNLMPCRADSLAIGMLAAVYWRTPGFREWLASHGPILYSLLAVFFGGVAALWKWYPESHTVGIVSGGFTWLAFFYVLILLLALARPSGPIARCARMRWLRELGRVSYCVYIIHLVVNVICHALLRHAAPGTVGLRATAVTIFAGFATFGIAWVSWKIFEGPLVRLGHSFRYEPAPAVAADLVAP